MLTANIYTLLCLQAERANGISQSQGMGSKVNYQVADALHQPFRDGQFDLIWSMESGEHMPDKAQFINELTRVCKPGGKILIVTWCHRCVPCTMSLPLIHFLFVLRATQASGSCMPFPLKCRGEYSLLQYVLHVYSV